MYCTTGFLRQTQGFIDKVNQDREDYYKQMDEYIKANTREKTRIKKPTLKKITKSTLSQFKHTKDFIKWAINTGNIKQEDIKKAKDILNVSLEG